MGFYRVDGYAQLFGNFIDGQSIYAQPDDLTLFGRQFINIKIQLPEQLFTDSRINISSDSGSFSSINRFDAWIYTFRGVTTSSTDYKQPGKVIGQLVYLKKFSFSVPNIQQNVLHQIFGNDRVLHQTPGIRA